MKSISEPRCPYQGLIPYGEADADFFFGRQQETQLIVANLFASPLTLLYGASGVGKSSVLRAGVTHSLGQRDDLLTVVFSTWQSNPLDDLKAAVVNAATARHIAIGATGTKSDALTTLSTLAQPEQTDSFLEFLKAACSGIDRNLLIILDQFEEYFLYHPQGDSFVTEFSQAVSLSKVPVSFLISIREDSLAKLDRFEKGIPTIFDNYLRLEHLDRSAAEAAIVEPLNCYNAMRNGAKKVEIEPQLVNEVLDQVKTGELQLGETGRGGKKLSGAEVRIETPFLQMVMTRLWSKEMEQGSTVLRLRTLEGLGNAERIVCTHLDDAMNRLTPHEQAIAASVFRHLVTPSGSKIAHSVRDLCYFTGLPAAQIVPVLNKLAAGDARILQAVAPPSDTKAPPRYEIYHDVLAAAILDWRRRFMHAQQWTSHEEQMALEQRRVVQRRIGFIAILLLIVALIISLYLNAGSRARERKAESREVAAIASKNVSTAPELSVLLALEAVNIEPTAESITSLREALLEYPPLTTMSWKYRVRYVSFSPDGKLLLWGGAGSPAHVWETDTGNYRGAIVGHQARLSSAIFSPDGALIATVENLDKPIVQIWETYSDYAKPLTEFSGHTKDINEVVFSPDSKLLVTTSRDGTARIWDARTGQSKGSVLQHAAAVNGAAFNRDGTLIVTGCWDGKVYVWETNTGLQKLAIKVDEGNANDESFRPVVWDASFSPDGTSILAATRNNRSALVLDTETGQVKRDLKHDEAVYRASFSSDGSHIVSVDATNTIYIWDAGATPIAEIRTGKKKDTNLPVFSADGTLIACGAESNARVWDLTGKEYQTFTGHEAFVYTTAFSPDGSKLATASEDGSARIWRLRKTKNSFNAGYSSTFFFGPDGRLIIGDQVWNFLTGESVGNAVAFKSGLTAFSPDGKYVFIADNDPNYLRPSMEIRDARSRELLRELPRTGYVKSAEFSADGKRLMILSDNHSIDLWDVETWQIVAKFNDPSISFSAAFSPDGKYIVTGSERATARVWDVQTKKLVKELVAPSAPVLQVAYSGDGKFILGSQGDGVTVWDAQTGEQTMELKGYSGAFSPDGHFVLTINDGKAHVWGLPLSDDVPVILESAGPILNAVFSPDGMFVLTITADGVVNTFPRESFLPPAELIRIARLRVQRQLTADERQKYLHW